MTRMTRMTPYEATLKLRRLAKKKPAGYHHLGEAPPELETPDGMVRITVVFNDGLGASMFMDPDFLTKTLPEFGVTLRQLGVDPTSPEGINRGRNLIYQIAQKGETGAAANLALYLAWHCPDADVPASVRRTIDEHGTACITLAIDWRLGNAATIVGREYADPFSLLAGFAAATMPAQGHA